MQISLVVFGVALPLWRAADSANADVIGDIHCDSVTLRRIDTDGAEIELTVAGTTKKSFTAESILFEHVSVNGIPLRMPPVKGPVQFRKGETLSGLPEISATVSFREIPSLEPIRTMIRDKTAHLHLELLARLDLNPVEIIAIRSRNLWVSATLDQDTALDVPGGTMAQLAAGAALVAAEPAWRVANRGREWRDRLAEFGEQARQAVSNSLVEVCTNFEVTPRGQAARTVEMRSVGFILPSGRVLTVDEAIEPWLYSATLAQALNKHEVSLSMKSVNTVIRLVNVDGQSHGEFALRNGEVQTLKPSSKTARVMSDPAKGIFRMALRDSSENVVFLQLHGFNPSAAGAGLRSVPDFEDWRKAAVFRFDSSSHVMVWVTDVKQTDGRLTLRDPIAEAAGSPIWFPSGVAGILQDDSYGETTRTVLKDFPLESF